MISEIDFANAMKVLYGGVGRKLDPQQVEVWFQCLRDLSIGSLQTAILRWLNEVDSGFPSIAAIRERASEATGGRLLDSDEAFALVLKVTARISPHYEPERFRANLPGSVLQAVESCGGVKWIADLETDNRTTYAAQFRRAYEAIAGRESIQRRLPEHLRPRIELPSPAVKLLADSFSVPRGKDAM